MADDVFRDVAARETEVRWRMRGKECARHMPHVQSRLTGICMTRFESQYWKGDFYEPSGSVWCNWKTLFYFLGYLLY